MLDSSRCRTSPDLKNLHKGYPIKWHILTLPTSICHRSFFKSFSFSEASSILSSICVLPELHFFKASATGLGHQVIDADGAGGVHQRKDGEERRKSQGTQGQREDLHLHRLNTIVKDMRQSQAVLPHRLRVELSGQLEGCGSPTKLKECCRSHQGTEGKSHKPSSSMWEHKHRHGRRGS